MVRADIALVQTITTFPAEFNMATYSILLYNLFPYYLKKKHNMTIGRTCFLHGLIELWKCGVVFFYSLSPEQATFSPPAKVYVTQVPFYRDDSGELRSVNSRVWIISKLFPGQLPGERSAPRHPIRMLYMVQVFGISRSVCLSFQTFSNATNILCRLFFRMSLE